METDPINFETEWKKVEEMLTRQFGSVPDFEGILYLIGINELQHSDPTQNFSKDEKQDLMHVGVCTLLQPTGFYSFTHFDEDGWPHFKKEKELSYITPAQQEHMLKEAMLSYFELD